MQPIYIIDAMNYIFRAYYALPFTITAPSGMLTNAILGYVRTLLRIIKEQKPQYMAVAFEGARSFRNEISADYKANRKETPGDLQVQFEYCRTLTEAMGISRFEVDAYEADDVIGTIATRAASLGHPVVIVTGDKDMLQLVGNRVRVYDIAKDLWLDENTVKDRWGVEPAQIPDLLALHGDHIDNIPGIPGVGEKTARQILSVCRNIEEILDSPQLLKTINVRGREGIVKKICDNIEAARKSRKLATIDCEVPLDVSLDLLRYRRGDIGKLEPVCRELGFRKVLEDIPIQTNSLFP